MDWNWLDKHEKRGRFTEKDITMRITMAHLEKFASSRGYTVERRGKMIEWYRNDNHSIIGVTSRVSDAYREIISDDLTRMDNPELVKTVQAAMAIMFKTA